MESIFDVIDYRDCLRSYYENRKKEFSLYSYRMMGSKLELDASQLFRILQKEQHLPARCTPMAKELLDLQSRAAEYFELIYAASKTRNKQKKSELFEKAFTLRDVHRRALTKQELRFLSQWWIAGVRSFLEVSHGKADPHYIATHLGLEVGQVKEALFILKELKLIEKQSSERFALKEAHLTVSGPEKSEAVREFQKQVMSLGAKSLEDVSVQKRDVSTLTMAMDQDCFLDVKEILRECRRQIQKRVEQSTLTDRVMQLNMAFFPISKEEVSQS